MPSINAFAAIENACWMPHDRFEKSNLLLDLERALDLYRNLHRQGNESDRRSGVATRISENLDEEIRATIDHFRLISKLGWAVDHSKHLDYALDAVEVAKRLLCGGDDLKSNLTGVLIALLDGQIRSNLP